MYAEDTTYDDLDRTDGIQWNGTRYARFDDHPALDEDEVALVPWDSDWDDWTPTDSDVIVESKATLTDHLQNPDVPITTW